MKSIRFLVFAILLGCGSSNEEEPAPQGNFISVRSLIEDQVKHVDTSLYAIIKVTYRDSSQADTAYIPREQFRNEAKDFLNIPDLADPKVARHYREEPAQYDEMLNRVIITYKPIDLAAAEIKKQELLVTPAPATGDKVNNILLQREISNRDSFLKQDLLWLMDRSFQVTTTTQKPGKPEIVTVTRVIWNPQE